MIKFTYGAYKNLLYQLSDLGYLFCGYHDYEHIEK